VLVGAWGARAGKLLERTNERRHAPLQRIGDLSMLSLPALRAGSWCCWLFGRPEDRGMLAERFGLDSEVDLPAAFGRALTELGEAACELLCGRFVVVILDRDRNRCLIVRDQLGAQPLVHACAMDGVLFAEHERDLLDLLPRTPAPDRLALLEWIENGLLPKGRTLYEGMRRLPAGHRLILTEGHVRSERWWDIQYQESEQGSIEALAARLRNEAFAAVGRAAGGSERPAVKLSGGLDSACVAAGLAGGGSAGGRALAIAGAFADHPLADETSLIKATARHTHLPLRLVAFDPRGSMLAPALAHIARWRLPPATPNLFLWQPLTACAQELGVDVMLDGEGGDELFGLARYLIADTLRAARLPTAWSLTGRIPGIGIEAGMRTRLWVLRRYGLSPLLPAPIRRRRRTWASTSASSRSLVPFAEAQALTELGIESEQDRRDGPLWWRRQVQSVIDMRELLDVAGHFSREAADGRVELRHPFLYDLRLIEVALRIPPHAQFDPVRDRPILRDALAGLIPEEVRTRHLKSHFSSLVLAGIGAEDAGLIAPLRRADAPIRAYVAPPELDRRIEVASHERSMLGAGALWNVAIANRWLLSEAEARLS
jgi:asparagine synthase (glutamine-hydrolysing)